MTPLSPTIDQIEQHINELETTFKNTKSHTTTSRSEIGLKIQTVNNILSQILASASKPDLRRLCEINSKLIDLNYEIQNMDNEIVEINRKHAKPSLLDKVLIFLHLKKPTQHEKILPHFSIDTFAKTILDRRREALVHEAKGQLITDDKNPERLIVKDAKISFKIYPEGCQVESAGPLLGETFETIAELMGKLKRQKVLESFKPDWFAETTKRAQALVQEAQALPSSAKPFCLVRTSTEHTLHLFIANDNPEKAPLRLELKITPEGKIEIDGELFEDFEAIKSACNIDSRTASVFLNEHAKSIAQRQSLIDSLNHELDPASGKNASDRATRVLQKMTSGTPYYLVSVDSTSPETCRELQISRVTRQTTGRLFKSDAVEVDTMTFQITKDGKLVAADGTTYASFAELQEKKLAGCLKFTDLETEIQHIRDEIRACGHTITNRQNAIDFVRHSQTILTGQPVVCFYEEAGLIFAAYYTPLDGIQNSAQVSFDQDQIILLPAGKKRWYPSVKNLIEQLHAPNTDEIREKISARTDLLSKIESLATHVGKDAREELQTHARLAGKKADGAFAFVLEARRPLEKTLYIAYIEAGQLHQKEIDTLSDGAIKALQNLHGQALIDALCKASLVVGLDETKSLAATRQANEVILEARGRIQQYAGGEIYAAQDKTTVVENLTNIDKTFGAAAEGAFAVYKDADAEGILHVAVLTNGKIVEHAIDLIQRPGAIHIQGVGETSVSALTDIKMLHPARKFESNFDILARKLGEIAKLPQYEEIYSQSDVDSLVRQMALHNSPCTWFVRRKSDASWAERLVGKTAAHVASSATGGIAKAGGWVWSKTFGSSDPKAKKLTTPTEGYFLSTLRLSGTKATVENVEFSLDPASNFEIAIQDRRFKTIEEAAEFVTSRAKPTSTKTLQQSDTHLRVMDHHNSTIRALSGVESDQILTQLKELDAQTGNPHYALFYAQSTPQEIAFAGQMLTIEQKKPVLAFKGKLIPIDPYSEPGRVIAQKTAYDSIQALVDAIAGTAASFESDWEAYLQTKTSEPTPVPEQKQQEQKEKKRTVTPLPTQPTKATGAKRKKTYCDTASNPADKSTSTTGASST